jgi:serine/threonine-protein kinase
MGRTLGSYRVARLLGRGGMGAVYLGVHPGIGSRVAIKFLAARGGHDNSDVQRFFAEARSVNLIQHENIINVLNLAYLPDGRPYIVMEYIEGASLSAHIRSGIGARRLVSLTLEILDALTAVHTKGIVHRDLKPDNVMLTREGRVKLLDFGIAKLRVEGEPTQHLTATGAVLGTPAYMSPEQALARPTDARSDLYSLGIILYQALTGNVPFRGDSLFEVLRQHVGELPPPVSGLRPDLPHDLMQLIERMLAKDPAARPQSAYDVATELRAILPRVPDVAPSQAALLPGAGAAQTSLGASTHWPALAPRTAAPGEVQPAVTPHLQPRPSWGPVQPSGPAPTAGRTAASPAKWLAFGAVGMLVLVIGGAALAAVLVFGFKEPSARSAASVAATAGTPPGVTALAAAPGVGEPAAAESARVPRPAPESLAAEAPSSAALASGLRTASTSTRDAADPSRATTASGPAKATTQEEPSSPPVEPRASQAAPEDPLSNLQTAHKTPRDVTITTFPDGANVSFNGRSLGKAPVVARQILPGQYEVVVSKEGYETATYLFVVHNTLTQKRFDIHKKLVIPKDLGR